MISVRIDKSSQILWQLEHPLSTYGQLSRQHTQVVHLLRVYHHQGSGCFLKGLMRGIRNWQQHRRFFLFLHVKIFNVCFTCRSLHESILLFNIVDNMIIIEIVYL